MSLENERENYRLKSTKSKPEMLMAHSYQCGKDGMYNASVYRLPNSPNPKTTARNGTKNQKGVADF